MTVSVKDLARYRRRNWAAFFVDYVTFGLGIAFASANTIMPAFVATLTDNKLLIGAVTSVWLGGWLLPQVFAANHLSHQPRKYPIMMRWQFLFRPVFPLFVLWLLWGGTRFPLLTVYLFLAMLAVFAASDAVVALAWFDMFAKALPAQTRGRLVGTGQVVTGISAIGVGAIIQYVLGPKGPPYPVNYAVIFGLASLCYLVSACANALIVEPREAVPETRPPLRDYFPQLARLWREDFAFNRVTMVRLLVGLGGLAMPFYVVYATQGLGLSVSTIGLFAAATMVGTAVSGLVLGPIADRQGSHRVIQITSWIAVSVPALVLLLHLTPLRALAVYLYPMLYVLIGMVEGSVMLGYLNFVLEISPPGQRPVYMGLTNTIAGLLVVVPLIGGWLLQRTSYPVLFSLAAAGILVGAILALTLPSPRRSPDEPPSTEISAHTAPAP